MTGTIRRIVDFLDGKQKPRDDFIKSSTRKHDGFPFADFQKSAPGQTLRADLEYRNQFPVGSKADIKMHMRAPSGRVITTPQGIETANPYETAYYGLETQIPQDAELGYWDLWATINGKEVAGSKNRHEIIAEQPIDRYSASNRGANNKTLSYDHSFGPQSNLRAILNRGLRGGF